MVHKFVPIPLRPLNFKAELAIIYTIAIKNWFDIPFVNSRLKEVRYSNIKNQLYTSGKLRETDIKLKKKIVSFQISHTVGQTERSFKIRFKKHTSHT